MAAWKAGFQTANPDVTVNYDAVGSGGGREQFIAGGVQFAGSDAYLDRRGARRRPRTQCGRRRRIRVPRLRQPDRRDLQPRRRRRAQPLALHARRRSSPATITKWNDDAIAADNPDADLPDDHHHAGAPLGRVGHDGELHRLPRARSPRRTGPYGAVETGRSRAAVRVPTVRPVSSPPSEGAGTIGYADASQAADLGHASIGSVRTSSRPTPEAAGACSTSPRRSSGRDEPTTSPSTSTAPPTAAGVYPIILRPYQMVCSTYDDQATADLVKAFESYVISDDGQDAAASAAGSAPITDAIRDEGPSGDRHHHHQVTPPPAGPLARTSGRRVSTAGSRHAVPKTMSQTRNPMTIDAGGAAQGPPPRRLGDSIFATICTASGIIILLTLAGVAIFLTYEGCPAFTASPRNEIPGGDANRRLHLAAGLRNAAGRRARPPHRDAARDRRRTLHLALRAAPDRLPARLRDRPARRHPERRLRPLGHQVPRPAGMVPLHRMARRPSRLHPLLQGPGFGHRAARCSPSASCSPS